MFQLIARHLLHTLNIIVVESFTTPHHYCPMSVQPLPALTVTQICMKIKKNVKGEKNMLNHLLRLIRAVLAEIIGTLLRKTVLA